MIPPGIPALAWIVISCGIAIVLILIVIYLSNLLTPVSWALFIVATGFGLAIFCPAYKRLIQFIKRH